MASDPYTVLGVSRSADADAIRKAYRKLAKELHPDRNPGDAKAEERFKHVSAAFDILGDPDKRARFDRGEIDGAGNERAPRGFGGGQSGGPWPGGRRPGGAGDSYSGQGGFEDISDLFSDLFAGRRQNAAARGRDVRYQLAVDFLDAVEGAKKRVSMADGRSLDLAIPKGLRDGQTLRLKGQGEPGRGGGAAGDVYVEVSVKDHPVFERKGDDIHIEAPISLSEAVLGGKITVPTTSGPVAVSVPKNASSGATLRLRGKGVGRAGGGAGDQYVRLKIVLPDKPDKDLEAFVKGWSAGAAANPRKDFEPL
ncbi:MAG: J domain-containing protein [Pseudomonadota bacterium]